MPTEPTDRTPDPAYLAAQIAGDERHPGDDGFAARSVTRWILAEMVDSLLMLAFANACDECDEGKMPHPNKPPPGGNFADYWREAEPDASTRAEAERTAAEMLTKILAHYDPAPALIRWDVDPAGDTVSWFWRERYDSNLEAAARCWGHYAVMEAIGHGVAWSDDNAPLRGLPLVGVVDEDGEELPPVGDLPGCTIDDVQWVDAPTRAAWAVLDAKAGR